MTDALYSRQERLPEVGASGQARLARGRARVPARGGGLAGSCYLERAGVGTVIVDATLSPRDFPHDPVFRHAEARHLAQGAWTALTILTDILEDRA